MLQAVQVYDGDGVAPHAQLTSWRMWRGWLSEFGKLIEMELLGYISKPDVIPPPPDKYLLNDDLYLTSDTRNRYHWNMEAEEWVWLDRSG